MPTPHISAPDGAFADTVLMPGDPQRAAHIADTFLSDAELVTEVRGMTGFTGTYDGVEISVMPSGMGMPSAAIYVTELVRFYGVKRLIRVGTCGVYQPDLALRRVVAGSEALTNSNIPAILGAPTPLRASPALLASAHRTAEATGVDLTTGPMFSSDIFYEPNDDSRDEQAANGVLVVEMEAAALYAIAAVEGVDALALVTTTDHLVTGEHLSADERRTSVDEMLELALRVGTAS